MRTIETTTQGGSIRGYTADGVHRFHGIPYAAAPIDALRFAPPQPAAPWDDVYDATFRRPIAPQVGSNLDLPMGPIHREQDEDCLTLTVATPRLDAALPVLVWFHGGANVCGAGDLDWYDGRALAKAGHIVVVNVNFRLGALGFLVHPSVNEENLSILDQMAALRWVRDHIQSFGGDPENVTVMGQSAGANAIVHMVSRRDTEGLFHKMILQSPSIGRANFTKAQAREIAEKLMEMLGIDPGNPADTRAALRAQSTQAILEATDRCSEHFADRYPGMLFRPVMDAWSTAQAAIAAAAAEAGRRRIAIIIGTTRDEMHAFSLNRDVEAERRNREVQLSRFDHPAEDFARRAAQLGCPVWKYRFAWGAPASPYGACHCIELPFVFGALHAWKDAPMLAGATEAEMARLRDTLQPLWCRFAAEGQLDEAVWPRFSGREPFEKVFDNGENAPRRLSSEQ